ncbi:hypothetical protein ACLIYP_03165 [Streptomyces nanhaiensis]|uniref:hypothetical protein n=1 Tax=Streptomyces nanhaiensis TaxID=679319 RepID=UPI00399D4F46
MGASGWEYVTPYEGTVEESLAALHAGVFQEEYGEGGEYRSVEELWADEQYMWGEGTHSVLDIRRVVHTSDTPSPRGVEDYGTLRPLARDRIVHHFGTERPSPDRFRELIDRAYRTYASPAGPGGTLLDECTMRWTGRYVLLYTGDEPTHLGIFGYSGD